jgi:hypothetical protein
MQDDQPELPTRMVSRGKPELTAIQGGKGVDHFAGRRAAAKTKIEDAKQRLNRWRMKHGDKLKGMHPDVADEIASVVWNNILNDQERPLTEKDLHQCRMRVASRLRVSRYRFSPPGDEESGRQLRECLEEIKNWTPADSGTAA